MFVGGTLGLPFLAESGGNYFLRKSVRICQNTDCYVQKAVIYTTTVHMTCTRIDGNIALARSGGTEENTGTLVLNEIPPD
jgi:hypothetical protein